MWLSSQRMYFSKFFEVPQKVLKTSLGQNFDFDSARDTIQSVPLT